jgi:HlyD family secretion protein
MKRWQRTALIAAAVIAVIVLLQSLVFRPRPIPVEAAKVARGEVEDAVSNSQAGTLKARHRSRLGAERAGRIVRLPHREGDSVAAGELLAQLDPSTAEAQLELARRDREVQTASQASAQAAFDLARAQFNRSEELHKQKLISDGEMDQVRTRLDETRAALAAAEAAVARAQAGEQVARDNVGHMKIVAPYPGVVAQRLVEVGESVIPGQAVIEIVALDELYVSASIDEVDIGRLREGLPARVTLDPYRGVEWQGKVSRVFPVVNDQLEQNRTLEVEVDLAPDPSKPTPRPGTSADVVIVLDTREGVLRVPTFAILEDKRVLVIERGKAVAREIETGLRNWEWTEVRKGLSGGETVVTSVDKLGVKAGARVQAQAANGAGGTSATRGKRP